MPGSARNVSPPGHKEGSRSVSSQKAGREAAQGRKPAKAGKGRALGRKANAQAARHDGQATDRRGRGSKPPSRRRPAYRSAHRQRRASAVPRPSAGRRGRPPTNWRSRRSSAASRRCSSAVSADAAATLSSRSSSEYPDEKELQERARVYLSICERQIEQPSARRPDRSRSG